MKLYLVAVIGWFIGACSGSSSIQPLPERDSTIADEARELHVPERDSSIGDEVRELACNTQKILFTQQTGCAYHGAVEFCLPVGDSVVMGKILELDRSISCTLGSSGRAECNRESEQLCIYLFSQDQCPDRISPLPEEVWKNLCQLAELDVVPRIVHTVYE